MTNLEKQLQARIESFASDITQILRDAVATSVEQALVGTRVPGAPPKRATKSAHANKPAAAKRRAGKGAKRDPKSIDALEKVLLREVKRKGDRRMEEIALALSVGTKDLKLPMQRLLDAKAVKSKGQARGTRYTAK